MTSTSSPLLLFYRHQGPDHAGRMLAVLWHLSHEALEQHHDFIQWLFPLPEPSRALAEAPRLTADDVAAFHDDPTLRQHLRRSLDVMLDFYGMTLTQGEEYPTISPTANAVERERTWLTPHNHNFLRLSRILRSLSLLGERKAGGALLTALETLAAERPEIIGRKTLEYWREAVA